MDNRQIVRALEGDVSLEDLNEGVRPGQSMLFSSGSGSEYEFPSSYTVNMQRIRKVVVASPEYSGEYGDLISEYGGHDRLASSGEGAVASFSDEFNQVANHKHKTLPQL